MTDTKFAPSISRQEGRKYQIRVGGRRGILSFIEAEDIAPRL